MKIRAAILLDNNRLTKWQMSALTRANEKLDIELILNCNNTKSKIYFFKNFLYYIINFFSLRNSFSKVEKYTNKNIPVLNFFSEYNENWQKIPDEIYAKLYNKNIRLVIKFGMGLLRIEKKFNDIKFLSFHHGNPSKFRGRPAGFYEILNNEDTVGIIVQELNNVLDGGKVLAFAETKTIKFSYKRTAINFYSVSEYLLIKAIENYSLGNQIKIDKNGNNYKLPSNFTVIRFILKLIVNGFKKIIYGLFYEKKWKIALVPKLKKFRGRNIISSKDLVQIPIKSNYVFYADPYFSSNFDSIRCEALSDRKGLGDILEINIKNLRKQKVILSDLHYSHPFSFKYKNKEYLLPEVAHHSSQYFLSVNEKENKKYYIRGLENKRILDSILIEHNNLWFIFFSESSTVNNLLNIWISKSIYDEFKPHPKSPVLISPRYSRMGGKILKIDDQLLRLAQNNSREYGESITILEITELSSKEYKERQIGTINMDGFKGPHCLNLNTKTNQIVLDYYKDEFSIFSSIRRIKSKISQKK